MKHDISRAVAIFLAEQLCGRGEQTRFIGRNEEQLLRTAHEKVDVAARFADHEDDAMDAGIEFRRAVAPIRNLIEERRLLRGRSADEVGGRGT